MKKERKEIKSENLIELENVSLRFNKPSERLTTLKEFFVRLSNNEYLQWYFLQESC